MIYDIFNVWDRIRFQHLINIVTDFGPRWACIVVILASLLQSGRERRHCVHLWNSDAHVFFHLSYRDAPQQVPLSQYLPITIFHWSNTLFSPHVISVNLTGWTSFEWKRGAMGLLWLPKWLAGPLWLNESNWLNLKTTLKKIMLSICFCNVMFSVIGCAYSLKDTILAPLSRGMVLGVICFLLLFLPLLLSHRVHPVFLVLCQTVWLLCRTKDLEEILKREFIAWVTHWV